MSAHDYSEALIAEAQAHRATDIEITTGGKHKRLWFTINGERRFYVFPATPSDTRGLQNSLSDLRKVMGVARIIHKSDRPKKRRRKPEAPESLPCLSQTPPKPHPFEDLPELWMRPYRERVAKRLDLALWRLSFDPRGFREWKRMQR